MKNNKYEMQQALLWNMRCLRSGFGKQVYSAKITEPGVPIGSSVRDAFAKVRRVSPGPPAPSPRVSRRAICYRATGL